MTHDVACRSCHRAERWSSSDSGRTVEVLVEGGARSLGDEPGLERASALIHAAREGKVVVGQCSSCAGILLGPTGAPSVDLPVETSQGVLRLGVEGLMGPQGALTPEEAEAFVSAQHRWPWRAWLGDLRHVPFFIVLLPIFIGWVVACIFVVSFLASIVEGGPMSVR